MLRRSVAAWGRFVLLVPLAFLLGGSGGAFADERIASFAEDLSLETPAKGWAYLWNAEGPIGDPSHYTPLQPTGHEELAYDTDGAEGLPSSGPGAYGYVGLVSTGSGYLQEGQPGGHPPRGRARGGGVTRFVIARYTVPTRGPVAVANSMLANASDSRDGVEVMVFVGDEPEPRIRSWTLEGKGSATSFDGYLGELEAGESVDVAIGGRERDDWDSFALRYDLVRAEPGAWGVAREEEDSREVARARSAAPESPPRAPEGTVMLVLDVSGSMWGRMEGREKIVIAREVVGEVLRGVPSWIEVGLMAYGHRRKGDCDDIELLSSAGATAPRDLKAIVDRLQPKGETPITRALGLAAKELEASPGTTHIVLVSDGKETCGGDPCARVKELRSGGMELTFHVIGFDVTGEEGRELRCVAETGGGRYFDARSGDELSRALASVQREVAEDAAMRSAVDASFEGTAEGWTIVGDGALDRSFEPALEEGALMAKDSATGGVWYWQAPSSFLGDRSSSHERELRYRMKTTPITSPFGSPDVVLEGAGLILDHDVLRDPGTEWTEFRIPLRAQAGWMIRATGEPATDSELLAVLSDLQRILIRGEFHTGADTGWLDDVVLGAIGK